MYIGLFIRVLTKGKWVLGYFDVQDKLLFLIEVSVLVVTRDAYSSRGIYKDWTKWQVPGTRTRHMSRVVMEVYKTLFGSKWVVSSRVTLFLRVCSMLHITQKTWRRVRIRTYSVDIEIVDLDSEGLWDRKKRTFFIEHGWKTLSLVVNDSHWESFWSEYDWVN